MDSLVCPCLGPVKKITRSFVYHLDQDFDIEINDESDKGQSVFNRKNKQNRVFSGININKKDKYCE